METIVAGYDGSEHADQALARAAELARALTAKLVVVSVGRTPRVMAPEPLLAPIMPTPAAPGALVTMRPEPFPTPPTPDESAETAAVLERARRFLARRDVDADFVSEIGDPAERLLQVADDRDADLIVVGSHERRFLERLLGAGVDEKLARRARCDLLLVH
jgi:nucleotide-binding universal stress UspA family protein